jgi:hypothetical protein
MNIKPRGGINEKPKKPRPKVTPVPIGGRVHEDKFKCLGCGTRLSIENGYEDTGMCSPCATGESETLEEFGDTW